jgi:hypothetical protein
MKTLQKLALVAVASAPLAALADGGTTYSTFDSSGAVTAIAAMVAGLILIGGAVFALVLGIKSTKWARKAL